MRAWANRLPVAVDVLKSLLGSLIRALNAFAFAFVLSNWEGTSAPSDPRLQEYLKVGMPVEWWLYSKTCR